MSKEMIEKVARAISIPQHHTTWDLLSDAEKDLFYMQAEYAIAVYNPDERLELYRDIFAEITFKAQPLCEDERDLEKVTGYRLPVGPLHRAAGKLDFQMFNGEAYHKAAVERIAELEAVNPNERLREALEERIRIFVWNYHKTRGATDERAMACVAQEVAALSALSPLPQGED